MRSRAPQVATLLAVAAGTLLACQPAPPPTPTPSPTTSPTPSPEERRERWGLIVLYEKGGVCTHLAGPPRIGAYRGEQMTWRIYNTCRKEATVEITDLRRSPSDDYPGFVGARSWEEIATVKQERKNHPERDPFEPSEKRNRVRAGAIDDLRLKVSDKAETGLYTYVVAVDGKPDEGDIEIWP